MSDNPGSVDLGSAHGKIVIDFSQVGQQFDSAINGVQQTVSDRLQNIGGRLQSFGRKWSVATLPVAGFLGAGIKAFADFDEILTEIEARTGATANEMEMIRQVALDMGRDTAFSATEASQAMLEMLSSGSSLQEAIAGLPHVLNLAAAGSIGLGESADAVTDILAQFQLGMEDSEVVVNALAAASQKSSATIPDLIAAFANVGPVAKSFGLSVDDTAAALAVFAENGIKGSEAGTQLRSMLNNMARSTEDTQNAWNALGTSLFDAEGNMRPLNDVIQDINAGLADKTPQEQQKIIRDLAGTYGQMGLTALLATNGIEDMQMAMGEAAPASELAAAKMESFRGRVRQLWSTLQTLGIKVVGPLIEKYLEPLLDAATGLLNKFGEWADENPKLAEAIGLVLVAIAALGPLLLGIGTAVSFAGLALGGLATLFGIILSPIGLLIAGLVALGAAYATNLFGFKDAVDSVAASVIPALGSIVAWAGQLVAAFQEGGLEGVGDFLSDEISNLWEDIKNIDWGQVASDVANGLLGALSGIDWAAVAVGFALGGPVGAFVAWFGGDILGIDWGELASDLANSILDWLSKPENWIALAAGFALGGPAGAFLVWFAGDILGLDWGELASDLANSIVDWLSKPENWIALAAGFALGGPAGALLVWFAGDILGLDWAGLATDIVDTLITELTSAVTLADIANLATEAAKIGDTIITAIGAGVSTGVSIVEGIVKGAINDLIPDSVGISVPSFTVEDPTGIFGDQTFGGGSVSVSIGDPFPGYAQGGMFAGNTPFIAGEGGLPELIVPRSSGMVVSNSQLLTAMNALGQGGGGGGNNIQIDNMTIEIPQMDTSDPHTAGRQIAQGFEKELRELLRSRG